MAIPHPRADSGASVSGAARDVDWRFLLPAPPGGFPARRVRLLGAAGGTAQLLVDLGVALEITETGPMDHRDTADVTVVLDGDGATIARATAAVPPGGVVYIAVDRRRPGQQVQSPGRLNQRLRQQGLRSTTYWRLRAKDRDTVFVPLGAQGAVPWFVREVMDDRGSSRKLVKRVLLLGSRGSSRQIGAVIRHYAIVAVSPTTRTAALTPDLLVPEQSSAPGDLLPLVLARGQGAWSRVVLLPFAADATQPSCVVKLAREAEHADATKREQRTLKELTDRLPTALTGTVPEARGIRTWSGLTVGTEQFLPGRPLAFWAAPAAAEGDPRLDRAVDWLVALHLTTTVRAPVALQHGDLTPRNVRWDGRRVSVVDWESARFGPGLCDLLYLLLHWMWPGESAFDRDPEAVLDLVFGDPAGPVGALASHQVRRYCAALQVDQHQVPALLVAMLVRQALDRAERVGASGADAALDDNLYARLLVRAAQYPGALPSWAGAAWLT